MNLSISRTFLPAWPAWALDILVVMTCLLAVAGISLHFFKPKDHVKQGNLTAEGKRLSIRSLHREFDKFRRQYISVYLVVVLADWLQGTHMYTLYLSYDVNISALFLTGYLSGAIFAPFLGTAVDRFGRKRSCLVYCILEIVINAMEHSSNFMMLLAGRVLGGISTNLLFSAFESWMTTEHRRRGFPEEWLPKIYSAASVGNGTMAILAGIVAQVLEDSYGHIGPFQGAIALTSVALCMILTWEENYGDGHYDECKSSLYDQFKKGWKTTLSNSYVWRIGLAQAFSEGAMFTFVFIWVPTLLSMEPPGGVPTGCVFSALMMAVTIGGMIFRPLHYIISLISKENALELSATLVYFLASCSMAFPALCFTFLGSGAEDCFTCVIANFMVIELCFGLYEPVAGTLRSKYVPDSLQGGILNIFRLPLNILVVAGTYATDVMEPSSCFLLISAWFMVASLLQSTIITRTSSSKVKSD